MATETQTTLGDCPTHGEVEATREIPRVTFPPIITAVRKDVTADQLKDVHDRIESLIREAGLQAA